MTDDLETQIREYLQRCLREEEPLVALERVSVASASGAPPMFAGSNPWVWLGLTQARLIVYYEGGRTVSSHRLGSLDLLELRAGMFKRRLLWRAPMAFDGEVAAVSKDFANVAGPLVMDPSKWRPLREEHTTFVARVDPISDPQLSAVASEFGLAAEHVNAYCVTCGGWCGQLENGAPQSKECPACLRVVKGPAAGS